MANTRQQLRNALSMSAVTNSLMGIQDEPEIKRESENTEEKAKESKIEEIKNKKEELSEKEHLNTPDPEEKIREEKREKEVRKSGRKVGRPKDEIEKIPCCIYMTRDTIDRLDRYVDNFDAKKTAIVERAVIEFLSSRNF